MAVTYQPSARPLYRATMAVWYLAGVIETLLGLRFILRLIGANSAAAFTDFIYTVTQPLVRPFANIVPASAADAAVFDWNILIAMAAYWLAAWAIASLFVMGRPVSESQADHELRRDKDLL